MALFSRKPRRVYVLGAGPAGLLAAHGAELMGYEVTVFSQPDADGKPRKSPLNGCQYLHEPIPGITGPGERRWVNYRLDGTPDGYRRKVYGEAWQGTVSPDEFGPEEPHPAWDLRAAYDKLWSGWYARIVPTTLNPVNVKPFAHDPHGIALATVPARSLCLMPDEHTFQTQTVYAYGETENGSQHIPLTLNDDEVVCNGHADTGWYRAARVFGVGTMEWPAGKKPPISGVVPVDKPLSTDCDCWVGKRWVRLGRYGQWSKGVLVHTAYNDAKEALS